MLRATIVLALVVIAGTASAETLLPPDPPRWRVRAALVTGVGGSRDQDQAVTLFPTTLDLGARLFGPLSAALAAEAVLVGEEYDACGRTRRPSAILGTAGLRVDFFNGKSAPWADPFVEAHAGVGRQGAPREQNGVCSGPPTFATGGGKLGVDVWLGRAAVTVVASYDWLPTAMPFAVSVGLSFIIH
jgi:hypothetical protein